jgi:hypothetical protein
MAEITRRSSRKKVTALDKGKRSRPLKSKAPEFPDGWICVAAYYIWQKEGYPDGRDANHWFEAKAQLGDLWKEGSLPSIE